MKNSILASVACFSVLFSKGALLALDPQLILDSAVVMDVLSKGGAKSEIRYEGQPAKGGKIDLTATNGFFERCFEALDQQKRIPGDEKFIRASFGYLGRMSDQVAGTARWHLWCAEAGEIKATFFMQVPKGEANHPWVVAVGEDTQTLKTNENNGESAQEKTLTFKVKQPGKVTLAIDCTKNPPPAETRLYYIRLEGSAIDKASLLRVRWRPSAVHARFVAPAACPAPKMWVFETRSITKTSSYSPLTTPFGYYGTSFKNDGSIPAGAGFNFSMWIAGRNATQAPPIEKMARLLGTDIPQAEYSTFGGEGTGVKFRNATAYKAGAERTIQALRIETDDHGLMTYYGYFFDEHENRWKLYASAQKPAGRKNGKNGPNFGTIRGTGSFCEIPGPPNRERSGDLVREIKRRGWFYGSDQKWYRAQTGGVDEDALVPREEQTGPVSNKRVYYMKDYPTEGWMSMATGGMELYTTHTLIRPAQKEGVVAARPDYLSAEKTAQLFDLPVQFGKSKASKLTAEQAAIDYDIKKTGPNSKAILYYGTVDALTYPAQKVTKGSPAEIDMHRPERTWQSATPEQKVTTGMNQFQLGKLKAGTTYYYRLFVTHDQGKSWDYQSYHFTTK